MDNSNTGNGEITYVCAGCRRRFTKEEELHKHLDSCPQLKLWLQTPQADRHA